MKTWIYIVACCLPLFFNFEASQSSFKEIEHQIYVKHPGEKAEVPTILTEVQNQEGLPISYYADVESVICLEQVCKVIPVRLFWNNIGHYQKYELAKGKSLEKYEADLFEPQDYVKIHDIMSNPNSPFKDVYIDEILTVSHEIGEDEVDAVSGATALALDEKDTVPGAALTCYTLWHWANGDVVSEIKRQTGKSLSVVQLKNFILNGNATYFQVAINESEHRNLYSKDVVDTVVLKVLKDDGMLREAFVYLQKAPPELYFYSSKRLFFEGQKKHKLKVIQSLQQVSDIPGSFLDTLGGALNDLNSYQEVSMLFNLLEAKKHCSNVLLNSAVNLLDSDFLIARRAYWFLSTCELSKAQKKRSDEFCQAHRDRL